ncbi:MAG: hypothetical protein K2P58_01605 [Hyphomonadaceae bacterium]|nr:hypothetical protein [Hyphomonadaceae bacterium]
MIAWIAAAGAALLMLTSLVRLFAGPTLHDRALALRTALIKAALVCAAVALATGRTEVLDVALALVFAALVLMTLVVKVFAQRTLQGPLASREE